VIFLFVNVEHLREALTSQATSKVVETGSSNLLFQPKGLSGSVFGPSFCCFLDLLSRTLNCFYLSCFFRCFERKFSSSSMSAIHRLSLRFFSDESALAPSLFHRHDVLALSLFHHHGVFSSFLSVEISLRHSTDH